MQMKFEANNNQIAPNAKNDDANKHNKQPRYA